MSDRDRIITILDQNRLLGGDRQLEMLEAEGYQVVPEGLVPQFDDLDDVSRMLDELGRISGVVQHNPATARDAARAIRQLRDLALTVLHIDRHSVGQTGE
jgi:hypothetical protein